MHDTCIMTTVICNYAWFTNINMRRSRGGGGGGGEGSGHPVRACMCEMTTVCNYGSLGQFHKILVLILFML